VFFFLFNALGVVRSKQGKEIEKGKRMGGFKRGQEDFASYEDCCRDKFH
jgi:hypothetical protein